jgi:hypothetical protein
MRFCAIQLIAAGPELKMVASESFAEFLREQLAPLGRITMRRMFGKTGVFCDGLMFAMVADDTFYFRVDDGNQAAFAEAKSFRRSITGSRAAPSTFLFGARRSGCSTNPTNSMRGRDWHWRRPVGSRRSEDRPRQSENPRVS